VVGQQVSDPRQSTQLVCWFGPLWVHGLVAHDLSWNRGLIVRWQAQSGLEAGLRVGEEVEKPLRLTAVLTGEAWLRAHGMKAIVGSFSVARSGWLFASAFRRPIEVFGVPSTQP
jgi:hypothetical protein